jgi:hypothetical protein
MVEAIYYMGPLAQNWLVDRSTSTGAGSVSIGAEYMSGAYSPSHWRTMGCGSGCLALESGETCGLNSGNCPRVKAKRPTLENSRQDLPPTSLEAIARRMALADRPDYADNEQFWEGYLPQARMWLAAFDCFNACGGRVHAVNAALEGGDVD